MYRLNKRQKFSLILCGTTRRKIWQRPTSHTGYIISLYNFFNVSELISDFFSYLHKLQTIIFIIKEFIEISFHMTILFNNMQTRKKIS